MIIEPAKRTQSVREYYFSRKLKEIDKLNNSRFAEGKDKIINLGIGAPDGMPPAQAIAALQEAAAQPGNHAYQSYVGLPALRQAFADWYERYYKVTLNPDGEIQPLRFERGNPPHQHGFHKRGRQGAGTGSGLSYLYVCFQPGWC